MSQKQKPDLMAALASAGGSTRRKAAAPLKAKPAAQHKEEPAEAQAKTETDEAAAAFAQTGARAGTAPITGHFPKQVRDQLKILAIERGSTLQNLMAEAYNDLFAKYGKPEIAPHQAAGQALGE